MKAQAAQQQQQQPDGVSLALSPTVPLVSLDRVLRNYGLCLHWNARLRTLEILPV